MDKVKVLFVLGHYRIGGPSKSLVALLDNLDYSMVSVDLIALDDDGALKNHINENVRIIETPQLLEDFMLPSSRVAFHVRRLLSSSFRWGLSGIAAISKHLIFRSEMNVERQKLWLKYGRELGNKLKMEQYDVAVGFAAGFTSYFIASCVPAKRKYHSVISDYRILNMDKEIERQFFSQMDGFLSVSDQCARIFQSEFPEFNDRTRVLYNYIPLRLYARLGVSPEAKRLINHNRASLVTVCRLDPLKGLDLALDACEELMKRGLDFKWYILGDGPNRVKVENEINRRGIGGRLELLGFQANTYELVKGCDVLVHPSKTEGKSNAVDEAKYLGVPVVVTNYPTAPDQVQTGLDGLICEMNGLALADGIMDVLSNPQKYGLRKGYCDSELNGDLTAYFLELSR